MPTQADKYNLAMAGEFFVAAQLQRHGVSASVTYGNAKRADVVAVSSSGKAVRLEVKTSSKGRWPIGNRVPEPTPQLWVFVHLPGDLVEAPEYFVISQKDLHRLLAPREQEYMRQYQQKHGEPYGDKPGVAAANRKDLESYKNRWDLILSSL